MFSNSSLPKTLGKQYRLDSDAEGARKFSILQDIRNEEAAAEVAARQSRQQRNGAGDVEAGTGGNREREALVRFFRRKQKNTKKRREIILTFLAQPKTK